MKKCLYFSFIVNFIGLYAADNAPTPPPRKIYYQLEKLKNKINLLEEQVNLIKQSNDITIELERTGTITLVLSSIYSNLTCQPYQNVSNDRGRYLRAMGGTPEIEPICRVYVQYSKKYLELLNRYNELTKNNS